MLRVAIATLGCKTNAYESSAIVAQFQESDVSVVPFDAEADVYIVNTCTVTGRTDFKSRNLIRKALARKAVDPAVRIVVTGCFAQREPDEIRALGEIDLIVDNQNKLDIASLLQQKQYEFADIMAARDFAYRPLRQMVDHSRAFQKIQDGCDFRCAYCAVPYGRGNSRSASFEDVLGQARLFVGSGYKEIVLGGVNLGLYNHGGKTLADVVLALREIQGLELLRLSSLEPMLFTPDLLDALAEVPQLCPHFHIALQSGCDAVLERMGRHYGTEAFSTLISDLLARFPDAAIGLDVIAGFPGETEAEFSHTLAFLEMLGIAYLHAFSFSRRKGTPAYDLPGQIPKNEINHRTNALTDLSARKKELYKQKLIRERIALRGVCESLSHGLGTFLSDHYIRGYAQDPPAAGQICRIVPQTIYRDGLR